VNQSQSQQQARGGSAALSSGALSPSLSRPISSTARTTSPDRGAAANFAPQRLQHQQQHQQPQQYQQQQQQYHHQQQQSSTRYRCTDPSMPHEALIVHGLYRLTAQQSNAYSAFVELLMQFDSFDELTETLVSLHEPGQLSELSLRSRAMLRYRGELEQRSTELWRRGFERLLSR
jgi:hypothetical protein